MQADDSHEILFVLRFYSPVNPMGSCQAQTVYLTTLLLGRLSTLKRLTSLVYILPETDNCHSQVSGRKRIENISWSSSPLKNIANSAGIESAVSWSPVRRASNWAIEAGNSHEMSRLIFYEFFLFFKLSSTAVVISALRIKRVPIP